MNLKLMLIVMTAIAVVSDSMLLPFYPQYFSSRFGVTDPEHVGAYIAAFCFTVMLALPVWAKVVKRVETLTLLVYTQLAAGLLSAYCYWAHSVLEFWLVSLGMFAFKGSYLLMYPYVMSLEKKANREGTIGLLSLIVHFGGILGAMVGGFVLQTLTPGAMFLLMAIGDLIQILMCMYQINHRKAHPAPVIEDEKPSSASTMDSQITSAGANRRINQLGVAMLIFYFSTYVARPFFASYWQTIATYRSNMASAVVFAIPGGMALLALWLKKRQPQAENKAFPVIAGSLLLGTCGLLLQAAPYEISILIGRCMFGWASFQLTVHLDLQLFEFSTPDSFAVDFSKINIYQNLGVIASSFAAGALVRNYGLSTPFVVAAFGFLLSLLAYPLLVGNNNQISLANT